MCLFLSGCFSVGGKSVRMGDSGSRTLLLGPFHPWRLIASSVDLFITVNFNITSAHQASYLRPFMQGSSISCHVNWSWYMIFHIVTVQQVLAGLSGEIYQKLDTIRRSIVRRYSRTTSASSSGGGGARKDDGEPPQDAFMPLDRANALSVAHGLIKLLMNSSSPCCVDSFLLTCKVRTSGFYCALAGFYSYYIFIYNFVAILSLVIIIYITGFWYCLLLTFF